MTADEPVEGRRRCEERDSMGNQCVMSAGHDSQHINEWYDQRWPDSHTPPSSPSVPVESREQPREEERWPEFEFIDSDGAWRPEPRPSVDETARLRGNNVYLRAELQQADATIRELRAEVADHEKRWQQRADLITRTSELRRRAAVLEAEAEAMPARYLEALKAVTAERDRARDLAAHLEEQLAQVARFHHEEDDHHGGIWCPSCGDVWPCAQSVILAAHLEAEPAEEQK